MELYDGLFKTLMDNLAEGVYLVDAERRIQYWNEGAAEITGFPAEEVVGKGCSDGILSHVDGAGHSLCQGGCPISATLSDGKVRH